jgi:hypothetical protein
MSLGEKSFVAIHDMESAQQQQMLTAEDLLFGVHSSYDVAVPQSLLQPTADRSEIGADKDKNVQLQPLSLRTFQRIVKTCQYDSDQISRYMIREGLINPKLTDEQIAMLPVGIANFLVEKIQWISGLSEKKTP